MYLVTLHQPASEAFPEDMTIRLLVDTERYAEHIASTIRGWHPDNQVEVEELEYRDEVPEIPPAEWQAATVIASMVPPIGLYLH